MNIIANRDGIGASKFELWFFKSLHLLTFKKSKHLKDIIRRIEADIEAIKNKQV
ncbi:hypothetical protein [Salinicoccus kekensis]|uniref:Uncharacterized protein n=1 Tax=Salinicoccus kekensis TaxID=714307 RepID=A0A285UB37_9STAP|nr:hypothetical protein [Salinicoccus kekensis]SOC39135.1 hypothetical protein SAMN05878391_0733 [Salinicoccus kekensis]